MPNPDMLGPATLTLGQGLGMFQSFMPKFTDIAHHSYGSDPAFESDVRMAEMAASLVTLGVGILVSQMTGSAVPATVSVVVVVSLLTLYEKALRAGRSVSVA